MSRSGHVYRFALSDIRHCPLSSSLEDMGVICSRKMDVILTQWLGIR